MPWPGCVVAEAGPRRLQRALARGASGIEPPRLGEPCDRRAVSPETDRRKDWAEKASTGIARGSTGSG